MRRLIALGLALLVATPAFAQTPPPYVTDSNGVLKPVTPTYQINSTGGGGASGTNGSTAPTSSNSTGFTNGSGNQTAVSPTTPLPVMQADSVPPSAAQVVNNSNVTVAADGTTTANANNAYVTFDMQGFAGLSFQGVVTGAVVPYGTATATAAPNANATLSMWKADQTAPIVPGASGGANIAVGSVWAVNRGARYLTLQFGSSGTSVKVALHQQQFQYPNGPVTNSSSTYGGLAKGYVVPGPYPLATFGYLAGGASNAENIVGIAGAASTTGFGVQAFASAPTALPNAAPGLATTSTTSSLVAKASTGNLYRFGLTQGATAGFLAFINAASAPTTGTAITPLYCIPVAANAGLFSGMDTPMQFTTGIVLLDTSSCSTYTAVTPVLLSAEAR